MRTFGPDREQLVATPAEEHGLIIDMTLHHCAILDGV
jgi:hypothetical protein